MIPAVRRSSCLPGLRPKLASLGFGASWRQTTIWQVDAGVRQVNIDKRGEGNPCGRPSTSISKDDFNALPDSVTIQRLAGNRSRIVYCLSACTPLPQETSAIASDLTQQRVRETGLASGLVDYKIWAIDEIWSGLRFARRRAKK